MIGINDQRPCAETLRGYQKIVATSHPNLLNAWPLLNGWDVIYTEYNGWDIVIFKDARYKFMCSASRIEAVAEMTVGYDGITETNKEVVRKRICDAYGVGPRDGVIFFPPGGATDAEMSSEYEAMLLRHRDAMGIGAMKLFLSHKGLDKPKVREFKKTLQLLGFDPWLDEDAMPAGTSLERGILRGFEDSCAAVFFVTANYKDEGYLQTEVDYAIAQKRKKGNKFAIVTLVFGEGDSKGTVPDLLHSYVWKEPKSDLQALDEIIKAIPIQLGQAHWR